MIHTDGRPTIAWANPPEDDEHHERVTCTPGSLSREAQIVKLQKENGDAGLGEAA